jgi:hypothetical protein
MTHLPDNTNRRRPNRRERAQRRRVERALRSMSPRDLDNYFALVAVLRQRWPDDYELRLDEAAIAIEMAERNYSYDEMMMAKHLGPMMVAH